MPDRETIIKDLEEIKEYIRETAKDIASRKCRMLDKVDNALALLKEQEPKFAKIDGQFGGIKYGRCPKCGKGLNEEVYPHWCGFCGQAVRWNETLKQEPDTLEPLVRLFDD